MTSHGTSTSASLSMTATVVIVTYRSADVLPKCLASIPPHAEVVIVNQHASDDIATVTRQLRPATKIIASGRNRGFGAGCNLGAANAAGDVLIFLNPDASFLDDSLDLLVDAVCANSETLVGPRLIDNDGYDITRARTWSSPLRDATTLLIPLILLPRRWRRDIPPDDAVYTHGGRVPYVQGACMAVGRRRFLRLGGFDEEFFLFGEEEYLAEQLAKSGLSAILEPRATIRHAEHTSVEKTRTFSVEQYHRTLGIRYRRNRASRDVGAWIAALRSLPLALVLLFLWCTSPARIKLSYREVQDATWCRAAIRGLLHGLMRHPVTGVDPAAPEEKTAHGG